MLIAPETGLPDQDDASAQDTGFSEEPGLAAERLERALERIAAAAHRAAAGGRLPASEPIMAPGPAREVAARLDALIAQLRTALDRN